MIFNQVKKKIKKALKKQEKKEGNESFLQIKIDMSKILEHLVEGREIRNNISIEYKYANERRNSKK